jgi:hypothetical protein
MPLTPWVKTRPSAIAGVDFGPGPWPVVLPQLLARGQIECRHDLAIGLPRVHDDAVAGNDGRCMAEADRGLPFLRQLRGPRRRSRE